MAQAKKSIGAAYALLLTFGYLGAHRFYLGRPLSGTLQAGLSLGGFGLMFFLGNFYLEAAAQMLSGGAFTAGTGILEGNLTETQRMAAWGVVGCLGGMLVWLLGDMVTMPFWEKRYG